MDWFIAKNVFQITSGDGTHRPQFEEQMVLINATNSDDAFQKALLLGNEAQEQFVNEVGELVVWSFINTAQVHAVGDLTDGKLLCVRTEEPDSAEVYINWVNESMNLEISS